jgi:prephenate dehydrogenase
LRGREVHATIGKLSCVASLHDALLAWPQAFRHFALIISALQLHGGRAARSDSMPI